ncbi:MAG: flavodoxin family protein [Eubacterium sp.]|nr:flavodoxin family protein [Eubacterium sp.]
MKTTIVYYSQHHGNTKKLLDAIAEKYEVTLIDVTQTKECDLSEYDRIGLASGIYYTNFAKPLLSFAEKYLPEDKQVFFIYTHGAPKGGFLKGIREITNKKRCKEVGDYHTLGFDTFGPFKLVGGVSKGHPTEDEIAGAVKFYESL